MKLPVVSVSIVADNCLQMESGTDTAEIVVTGQVVQVTILKDEKPYFGIRMQEDGSLVVNTIGTEFSHIMPAIVRLTPTNTQPEPEPAEQPKKKAKRK